MKDKGRRNILIVKLAAWLLVVPVLYLMPHDIIYNGHPICIFRNIFGVECPGCGMTRAIFSLMHLHFADAWHYNRLVVIVAPLLAYVYLKTIWRLVQSIRKAAPKQ